jgi:LacI family transcriptional regulator
MSKPATIRDVANIAKVSTATVSRYLNKSLLLPDETARRIEKACKRLAYRPNALAKRFSRGAAETIGLVTPEIANPFFASLAAAAEAEARRHGYSLLIMSTGGDPDIEIENIDRLDSRDVDGLIVLTNRADDGRIRERISGRADVVLLDEDVPGAEVSRIFVENEQGAFAATSHLIARGHRRIAHIGGPADLFSARERYAGFVRALRQADLTPSESWIKFGDYDRESGLAATLDLFSKTPTPTALFAGSDYIAIGVLQALRQLGLEAPAALSIVGFDDMPFAEWLHPPLTTVRQPIAELGTLGVRTLIAALRGEPAPTGEVRLRTQLIERGSVIRRRSDLKRAAV